MSPENSVEGMIRVGPLTGKLDPFLLTGLGEGGSVGNESGFGIGDAGDAWVPRVSISKSRMAFEGFTAVQRGWLWSPEWN